MILTNDLKFKVQREAEDYAYRMLWKEILSPSCRILVDIRGILMEGRGSLLTDEYGGEKKERKKYIKFTVANRGSPILNLGATINTAFLLYESCIRNEF